LSDAAFDVFHCPLQGRQIVEASAGTGKTWNLCALYLRLLLERGLTPAQVLVVTFSQAATAELRERIRQRLVEAQGVLRGRPAAEDDPFMPRLLDHLRSLGKEESALLRALEAALQSFDDAAIQTIHGFSQRALADTPLASGSPLAVETLTDERELQREVARDFWRRELGAGPLDARLADWLVQQRDGPETLAALLRRRLLEPQARELWPRALGDAPGDAPDGSPGDAPDTRLPPIDDHAPLQALAQARDAWQQGREEATHMLLEACAAGRLRANQYKSEHILAGRDRLDAALAAGARNPPSKEDEKALARFGSAKISAALRKGEGPPPRHAVFDAVQALLDARAARLQALSLARLAWLRRFLAQARPALQAAKRECHLQGFGDMLDQLHEALSGPQGSALAASLRQRWPAALVDEFQDTDPLQYGSLRRIFDAPECTLVMVGDPKQAIYRFRGADLDTYLRARDEATRRWSLLANQRSTPALVEAVNRLFGGHARAFMQPGLDYPPATAGERRRAPLEGPLAESALALPAALTLWALPENDADGQRLVQQSASALAVAACAAQIARLLATARDGQLRLGTRALAAGDVAVLVRTHAEGATLRRALAEHGVGSVELSQASVFASPDAQDLERLLRAVAEPTRTRRLAAALATAAMGYDAADLARLADGEGAEQPHEGPATWADHVAAFSRWHGTWATQGIAAMLRQWAQQSGATARLLSRPDGERRLTNLRHLTELLHAAEREHPGMDALRLWLQDERRSDAVGDERQLRLESDRSLVQIVTVHRAKGLEYAVVFCPLLWRAGGSSPKSPREGFSRRDADGRAVIDFRLDGQDGFTLDEAKAEHRLREAQESLRLIYVALTRAIHRCVLVVGSPPGGSVNRLQPRAGRRALLNWLVAGGGMGPADWFEKPAEEAASRQAWQALAASAPSCIAFVDLPADDGARLPPAATDPADLEVLPAPTIKRPWRIASYSSLVGGIVHGPPAQGSEAVAQAWPAVEPQTDAAARDHDHRTDLPGASLASGAEPVGEHMLDFPRGAAAGDCVHAFFEALDFGDRDSWPATAQRVLRRHQGLLDPALDPDRGQRMLLSMAAEVLTCPLPLPAGGLLRLQDLSAARRRHELEFHLGVERLDAPALRDWLAAQGQSLPGLNFPPLQGYVKGYIDLVFEHQGRWYLLDWKSNHLGRQAQDYRPAALQAAMAAMAYPLQLQLYALALHRLLRRRLAAYDPDRHFGGAYYLFVRGIRAQWQDTQGRPCGVHVQRPDAAALDALDRLLAPASPS
jgi:exodeoxyribonuclease V beta subunit